MEGVQVVGNSQCSVAFREQYSRRVSLEHGQRRWRRDEIWQTVPHSRRGHGKGTAYLLLTSSRRHAHKMYFWRYQTTVCIQTTGFVCRQQQHIRLINRLAERSGTSENGKTFF